MVTLGDVWAILATFIGVCVTSWALLLACSMLFQHRCERAAEKVIENPGKSILVGLLSLSTSSVLGVVLLSIPNPLSKLLGWMFILSILSISAIGAGGIAQVAARRIKEMDPECSDYQALSRGAIILVGSGMVPVLGWAMIAPVILMASLGSALTALFKKDAVTAPPVILM